MGTKASVSSLRGRLWTGISVGLSVTAAVLSALFAWQANIRSNDANELAREANRTAHEANELARESNSAKVVLVDARNTEYTTKTGPSSSFIFRCRNELRLHNSGGVNTAMIGYDVDVEYRSGHLSYSGTTTDAHAPNPFTKHPGDNRMQEFYSRIV